MTLATYFDRTMTIESWWIDAWGWLWRISDVISLLTFFWTALLAYLIRSLYVKKTDVGLIITKSAFPNSYEIDNALWFFNKQNRILDIGEISTSTMYDSEYVSSFLARNESKISDLIKSENRLSLFLFAHMPILVCIWHRLQDYKPISLFHKLRIDKRNKWRWKWTYPFSLYFHNRDYELVSSKNIREEWINTDVVLELSITSNITWAWIVSNYENLSRYRLELIAKNLVDIKSYLVYKQLLSAFTIAYRDIVREIENTFWENTRIHLVLTTPSPFAFIAWQYIHPNWPELLVYDKNSEWIYEVMCHLNKRNNF